MSARASIMGARSKAAAFAAAFFFSSFASATPFKLLTTETGVNPNAKVVAGLQEVGVKFGPVFIDTNPLYDVLFVENLGAKFSFENFAVGARYIWFAGSSVLENQIKRQEPRITKFSLNAQGPMLYGAYTQAIGRTDLTFNFQYADISGSKVTSPILAVNTPIGTHWHLAGELGYDFTNKQPRLSAGFVREGPQLKWRLGVTYVKIEDPYLKYTGVAPILDFYWLFGGTNGVPLTTNGDAR